MVNYLYELADIDANHSEYVASGRIAASPSVLRLLDDPMDEEGLLLTLKKAPSLKKNNSRMGSNIALLRKKSSRLIAGVTGPVVVTPIVDENGDVGRGPEDSDSDSDSSSESLVETLGPVTLLLRSAVVSLNVLFILGPLT